MTRDPIIMKFIRREADDLKLSPYCSLDDYKEAYPDRHVALLNRCSQRGGCFDEVIPRFHVVHDKRSRCGVSRPTYPSLAEKFLKYYWSVTILFRIRQATDPKNVVRILEHGLNTNSYKFALLRSLGDIYRGIR